ncbi:MAG: hypothetical protein RLZ98_2740 [Pseudomonadota bacterium]|jgi:hypothetical protein
MNGITRALTATIGTLLLLAVEAFCAMLTYTLLQIYSVDLFGHLVSLSRGVMNVVIATLQSVLPGMSTQFEASLGGELSPKAVLLLLIGLVVGAIIRFVIWSVSGARH